MLPLWLALQLAALALAAARVPFSAHFIQPAERAATVEMLVVQIATSALLFPSLFRNATRFVLAAVSAWPMLRLAALLGGQDASHVYAAATYVTLWLAALAAWRTVLTSERSHMIAVAAASLWAIGGPFLLYLHAEYGGLNELRSRESTIWTAAAGPVFGAMARLSIGWTINTADLPMTAVLLAGIIFAARKKILATHHEDNLSTKLSTN